MTTSTIEIELPGATALTVSEDILTAELSDGRTITVPLSWYPRLVHATQEERDNWQLFGGGRFIHWPDLDEDLSVEGLLAGWPSQEGERSFRRWLEAKRAGLPVTIHELQSPSTGQSQ